MNDVYGRNLSTTLPHGQAQRQRKTGKNSLYPYASIFMTICEKHEIE